MDPLKNPYRALIVGVIWAAVFMALLVGLISALAGCAREARAEDPKAFDFDCAPVQIHGDTALRCANPEMVCLDFQGYLNCIERN